MLKAPLAGYWLFFIFPLYAAVVAVLMYTVGWSGTVIYSSFFGSEGSSGGRVVVAILSAIPTVTVLLMYSYSLYLESRVRSPKIAAHALSETYSSSWARYDYSVLRGLADNPNTPGEVLRHLNKHRMSKIAKQLMRLDQFRWINRLDKRSLQERIADNPNTPGDELRAMFDGHDRLRIPTARNPSFPNDLLRSLSKHESERYRSAVGRNPSTPKDVLLTLSKDDSVYVRRSVASNQAAPSGVLKILSVDADSQVRRSVATNPLVTEEILARLAKDDDNVVRYEAMTTLNQRLTRQKTN